MTSVAGHNMDPERSGLNQHSPRGPAQHTSLSLEELGAALGDMLQRGDDPYATARDPGDGGQGASELPISEADDADSTPISPRSILEAMLFVGSPVNEPLTSKQVASLMRGVRPAEIDQLVGDLNRDYDAWNCPYTIAAEGAGYRLMLRDKYARIRDQFYGKTRSAKLSQAAIEVLAVVAYQPGIAADDISRLRAKPSGHILAQLVRRQLLRLERGDSKPRLTRYFTTSRFLELFALASLADLPQSQDLEQA
ncbi:MAG TPA: SMC-Scp complex subunit ScpB [Pirellulales bacterium]|nr:SMC-Scp complex subunit ScpB [Pirellulales bacterium]